MTRDVLARKLARLEILLTDLRPHSGRGAADVEADPYEVERLLELLVQVAVDILGHDLAKAGVVPESYRKTFLEAGRHGILPADLAAALADAGGMRNILVHLYEEIDYAVVSSAIDRALADFAQFARIYADRLAADDPTWSP